jgi:hypothetical protein
MPLPPYTPQLQPVESAWPPLKEPLANKAFDSLDEVQGILTSRCQWFNAHPDILKGHVGFGWVGKLGCYQGLGAVGITRLVNGSWVLPG